MPFPASLRPGLGTNRMMDMDYLDKDFGKILKNNAQTLRHDLLASGTDCFRVYDRNLSRYPVTVDLYGRYAKVTDYGTDPMSDDVRESCLDICARMLYLEPQNVVYAFRAKRVDRAQHEKTESEPVVTTVKENGLLFKVDLTSYVDTGLFLDHAVTRQLIRERSANADVLNLFSYTGSFSVYAAAGLANSVTSVDMSATYTRWAQENLAANGYSGDMYSCICMDAAKFVRDAEAKGLKYDIIIFDPPSFSNSHKMDGDFDVARDYALWVRNLLNILKKTGIILFSTNLGSFRMDKRRLRGLSIKEITGLVAAPGFVKDRAGTVRSWMMAFDDDSLSLDWSEPEKKSVKSSDRSERPERKDRPGRPYGREGERRSYGSSYGRRDRDRNDDRRSTYRRDDRRDDRRERRDFDRGYERGNDRDGERPFRRERREDRPYSDRGYGRSYDRSERADRPERRFNREDREERKERGERSFGRSYDRDDRPERSRRSFDQKRSFQRDDSEGRPFRKSFDRKPFDSTARDVPIPAGREAASLTAMIPSSPPAHVRTATISSGMQRIWTPRRETTKTEVI